MLLTLLFTNLILDGVIIFILLRPPEARKKIQGRIDKLFSQRAQIINSKNPLDEVEL